MTDHEQLPIPGFYLDPKLVKRFVADKLDEDGQAELAEQIAIIDRLRDATTLGQHVDLRTGLASIDRAGTG
jgi:hypothetical protein